MIPVLVVTAQAIRVGKARKEHNIKYPIMYSSENGGDNVFNCVQVRIFMYSRWFDTIIYLSINFQRAHQHTVENFPQFLFLMMTAGLKFPRTASAAGCIWLAGRIAFAKGYSTGKAPQILS